MSFLWVPQEQWDWLIAAVARIDKGFYDLTRKEGQIMATLDDILADVTAESTRLDSLSTLLQGLKDQLTAALASAGTLTPAQQATIDQIFAAAETNKGKIAAAIEAGTT